MRKSIYKILSSFIAFAFLSTSIIPPQTTYAQLLPQVLNLPVLGTLIQTTPGFSPALIRGVTVNIENPLEFTFTVDTGDQKLSDDALRTESTKLIKYFLASITVPKDELWVNLSPYEQNRIIGEHFGATEMGQDLLSQDYMLKQLTASLIHPEKDLGRAFWQRVRDKAFQEFGTTDIPFNTFNKVWIVPQEAEIFVHNTSAYVLSSHLKVMLEEDYLAQEHHNALNGQQINNEKTDLETSAQIVKEIIIPEIEREVNEGEIFANLRQIYNSMILAVWYKDNLQKSLLAQVYADKSKIKGVDSEDPQIKDKIYNQYLEAFKVGVYDLIREDYDPQTQSIIPRKYFSGGVGLPEATYRTKDAAQLSREDIQTLNGFNQGTTLDITVELAGITPQTPIARGDFYNKKSSDAAMVQETEQTTSNLLIPEDAIDSLLPLMLDGYHVPFDGRVYGNEEDEILYRTLAKILNLSGTAIDVGQGYNPYPADGLRKEGVQEVVPINLIYKAEYPEEIDPLGFIDGSYDDLPKQWFGIDAGGYEDWGIPDDRKVSAVIYNRSISYTSVYPKPIWRSPFSWRNFGDFSRKFLWESWGHVQKSFKHAYNNLDPNGKIIILNGFNENIPQRFRASVTRQFRKRVEHELRKAGFINIQIITKYTPSDNSRGLVLVVAQKPSDAAMVSREPVRFIPRKKLKAVEDLIRAKDYEKASVSASQLVSDYPDDPLSWTVFIRSLTYRKETLPLAIQQAETALLKFPYDPRVWDIAARAYFYDEQIVRANELVTKGLDQFPYSEDLQTTKARVRSKMRRLRLQSDPAMISSSTVYKIETDFFNDIIYNDLGHAAAEISDQMQPSEEFFRSDISYVSEEGAWISTSIEDFVADVAGMPNFDTHSITIFGENGYRVKITKQRTNTYLVETALPNIRAEREVEKIIKKLFKIQGQHVSELEETFGLEYTDDYAYKPKRLEQTRVYEISKDEFNTLAFDALEDFVSALEEIFKPQKTDVHLRFHLQDKEGEIYATLADFKTMAPGIQEANIIQIEIEFDDTNTIIISASKEEGEYIVETAFASAIFEKEALQMISNYFERGPKPEVDMRDFQRSFLSATYTEDPDGPVSDQASISSKTLYVISANAFKQAALEKILGFQENIKNALDGKVITTEITVLTETGARMLVNIASLKNISDKFPAITITEVKIFFGSNKQNYVALTKVEPENSAEDKETDQNETYYEAEILFETVKQERQYKDDILKAIEWFLGKTPNDIDTEGFERAFKAPSVENPNLKLPPSDKAMLTIPAQRQILHGLLDQPTTLPYSPIRGLDGLSNLISRYLSDNFSPEDILVTPGVEHSKTILQRILTDITKLETPETEILEFDADDFGINFADAISKLRKDKPKVLFLRKADIKRTVQLQVLWNYVKANKLILVVDESAPSESQNTEDYLENEMSRQKDGAAHLVRLLGFDQDFGKDFSGHDIGALMTHNRTILQKYEQYAQSIGYSSLNRTTQHLLIKALEATLEHEEDKEQGISLIRSEDDTNLSEPAKQILKYSATLVHGPRFKTDGALRLDAGASTFKAANFLREGIIDAIGREYDELYDETIEAVQNYLEQSRGLTYTSDEIFMGMGLKPLLTDTLLAIAEKSRLEGKKMKVTSGIPFWASYRTMAKFAGGTFVEAQTQKENNFKLTPKLLNEIYKDAGDDVQRVVMLTTPGNPAGQVYTKEELIAIAQWAVRNNAYILSDEIYGLLTFIGQEHISIASLEEEAGETQDGRTIKDLTLVFTGLAKEAAGPGIRSGTVATTERSGLLNLIEKHLSGKPDLLALGATKGAYEDYERFSLYTKAHAQFVEKNLQPLKDLFEQEEIYFIPAEGAIYIFADISKYYGKTITDPDDSSKTIVLNEKNFFEPNGVFYKYTNIAHTRGSAFGMPGFIRFSVATEQTAEAAKRIKGFLAQLTSTDAAMVTEYKEYTIDNAKFKEKLKRLNELVSQLTTQTTLDNPDILLKYKDKRNIEKRVNYQEYQDNPFEYRDADIVGALVSFSDPYSILTINSALDQNNIYIFELNTTGPIPFRNEVFVLIAQFFEAVSSDPTEVLHPTIAAAFAGPEYEGSDAADAASLARDFSRKLTELLHEINNKDQAGKIRARMLELIDEQADDYEIREIKLWESQDTTDLEIDIIAYELIRKISIYLNTSVVSELTADDKKELFLRLPASRESRIRILTTLLNTFRMFRISEIQDPIPEVIKFSPSTETRTKKIATLGPASDSEEGIRSLILDGTNVFRLNFSHINTDEEIENTQRVIDTIRRISEELKRPVGILADLSGPKMRAEQTKEDISVTKGEAITLIPKKRSKQSSVSGKFLTIDYPFLMTEIKVGEIVKINDGKVTLEVTGVDPYTETITTQVLKGTIIPTSQGRKSVNFPKSKLSVSSITEKDKRDLKFIVENNIGLIALSFVKTARDVQDLKVEIARLRIDPDRVIKTEEEYREAKKGFDNRSRRPRIIAKIETPQALENIDEIIAEVDSLMVARGDLSVEVGKTDVPFHTEELIEQGQRAGKPVILATEVFDSLADSEVEREPSSGEIDAIYQTIRNRRPDAVMFSGETALGKNPNTAIQTADTVARNAERDESQKRKWSKPATAIQTGVSSITGNISAHIKDVQAVFVFTRSGDSALEVAKHRGAIPIVAITNVNESIPILTMTRGVHPVLINDHILPGSFGRYSIKLARELYKEQIEEAKGEGRSFYIGIQHGTGSTRQFLDSQPIEEAPGVSGQTNQFELYDLAAENGDAAMIRSTEETARLESIISFLNDLLNSNPFLSFDEAAEYLDLTKDELTKALRKIEKTSYKQYRKKKIDYKYQRKLAALRKRNKPGYVIDFETDIKPLYELIKDWTQIKKDLAVTSIQLDNIFADTLWPIFRENILLSNTEALKQAGIDFTGLNINTFLEMIEFDINAVWFDAIVDIFTDYYTFKSSTSVKRHNGSMLSFTYGEIWDQRSILERGELYNSLSINDWVEHADGSRIQVKNILLREGSLNHERAQAFIGYNRSGFEHFFERHGTTFQTVINTVHTKIALAILRRNPHMPSTSIAGILSIGRQTLSRQMEAVTGLSFVANRDKIQQEADSAMNAQTLSEAHPSVAEIFDPLKSEIKRIIKEHFNSEAPNNVEEQQQFAQLMTVFVEQWLGENGVERLKNLEGLQTPNRPGPKQYERNLIDQDSSIGLSVIEHAIDGATPIHGHGGRFAFVIPLDDDLLETFYYHQIGIQENMAIYKPAQRTLQKGKIYTVRADYPDHKVQGKGKFIEIYISGKDARPTLTRLTPVEYPNKILEGGLQLLDGEMILASAEVAASEFPYQHRHLPSLTDGWEPLTREEALSILSEIGKPVLFQQGEVALPPSVALANYQGFIWPRPILYQHGNTGGLLLSSEPLTPHEVNNSNERFRLNNLLQGSDYEQKAIIPQGDETTFKETAAEFTKQITEGAEGRESSLPLYNSFLKPATGNERGVFIALDFGGTNARALKVKLEPGEKPVVLAEAKANVEEFKTANAQELFTKFSELIAELDLDNSQTYKLGFTFSFPLEQTDLTSGSVPRMSKGWKTTGLIGKNPGELLTQALSASGQSHVQVAAIINDTVGTQLTVPQASLGVIMGTGFNISGIVSEEGTIKNFEAGGFSFIPESLITDIDRLIQREYAPENQYHFEKMISGAYLPEILALTILKLQEDGIIFQNLNANIGKSIDGQFMSNINGAENLAEVVRLLKEKFSTKDITFNDARYVYEIVLYASKRSAGLVASAIAGAIQTIDPKITRNHTVAIDGTLYEKHPNMSRYIKQALEYILGYDLARKINIVLTKDGSGIGAAIAAAVSSKKAIFDKAKKETLTSNLNRINWKNLPDAIKASKETVSKLIPEIAEDNGIENFKKDADQYYTKHGGFLNILDAKLVREKTAGSQRISGDYDKHKEMLIPALTQAVESAYESKTQEQLTKRLYDVVHIVDAILQVLSIEIMRDSKESDSTDKATLTPSENVGGIDLNPDMLNLKIHRDSSGMPLPLPQQPLFKMNIQGFVPVIINIQPVNIPVLLGLTDEKEAIKIGYISQKREQLSYNKTPYSRDPVEFAYRDN